MQDDFQKNDLEFLALFALVRQLLETLIFGVDQWLKYRQHQFDP
jgi:hypothetical protein